MVQVRRLQVEPEEGNRAVPLRRRDACAGDGQGRQRVLRRSQLPHRNLSLQLRRQNRRDHGPAQNRRNVHHLPKPEPAAAEDGSAQAAP